MKAIIQSGLVGASLLALAVSAQADDKTVALSAPALVEQAMHAEHRPDSHQQRNRYRNPVGTLDFFGVEPGQRVLEIFPGGGWYAGILAPLLKDEGEYTAAIWDESVDDLPGYVTRINAQFNEWLEQHSDALGEVRLQPYFPPHSHDLGGEDYYDRILTFRNIHGWVRDGIAEEHFAAFFRALKPGGVLGVVQHRADEGVEDVAASARTGYVPESHVIALAEAAGFELQARSEVNANPRDSKDHEMGVWTLPPSLRGDEADHERMLAIGESDRMTLRFVKP